jgi:hypothetical protein
VLCAHGGGYVAGSMDTHRKTYAHVAKAMGRVGSPNALRVAARAISGILPKSISNLVQKIGVRLC